jgi:hypothetical protein
VTALRDSPYEYEHLKRPIDILCGTDRIRRAIEDGRFAPRRAAAWARDTAAFRRRRTQYLLYQHPSPPEQAASSSGGSGRGCGAHAAAWS